MPIGPEHLSSLINRYSGPLTLYARQWCDTADGYAPDDVVQEAFMQLARQRTVPHDPPAWLYRTVRNGAVSATRRAVRRRRHEQSAAAARPDWFHPPIEVVQEAAAAVEALQTLEAQTREIVTAHLWGGLTFEQIAGILDVSSSTAHRRYQEGLEHLRTRLERPCMR